ncbi:hypothetical protein [Mesobacillus foraminis]|uniref:hypothetical protein n=1 Tax=Mesobacillus foraminis TaxID=279826 RepID=UPI0013CE92AA|nr:hypothetical protein [Mesobacillus foraminis]
MKTEINEMVKRRAWSDGEDQNELQGGREKFFSIKGKGRNKLKEKNSCHCKGSCGDKQLKNRNKRWME